MVIVLCTLIKKIHGWGTIPIIHDQFRGEMGGGTPPIDSRGRPRPPLTPHDAWEAASARFAAGLANLTRFGGAKYWSIQYLL